MSDTLYSGQKIGVHDHKPYDTCQIDCPAHPHYAAYVARVRAKYGPPRVTRVALIDHRKEGNGLVWEKYNVSVRWELQDDGRTLKVWVTDGPSQS